MAASPPTFLHTSAYLATLVHRARPPTAPPPPLRPDGGQPTSPPARAATLGLVQEVVRLVEDEDEDGLRDVLRRELGWPTTTVSLSSAGPASGDTRQDDALLDQYSLAIMHTVRDDENKVPFVPALLTPKRPLSRTSSPASSTKPAASTSSLPAPLRALSSTSIPARSQSPSSSSSVASSSLTSSSLSTSYPGGPSPPLAPATISSSSSGPSPRMPHALPRAHSPSGGSPVGSSPKLLSASALEFRPSPRPAPPAAAAAVPTGDWPIAGQKTIGRASPRLIRSGSSNLAIAQPLYGERSASSYSPTPPLDEHAPGSSSASSSHDLDLDSDSDDGFSPFGSSSLKFTSPSGSASVPLPSTATTPSSSWPPFAHGEYNPTEADLALEEYAAALDMAPTPLELLSGLFPSLTPHALDVALHQNGYDLDSTLQHLLAAPSPSSAPAPAQHSSSSSSSSKLWSASSASAAKPFLPQGGYVVSGGRHSSSALLSTSPSAPSFLPSSSTTTTTTTTFFAPPSSSSLFSPTPSSVASTYAGAGAPGSRTPYGGRICRYFLQGDCRRADCRFSHDIERALCRFWLRGQCAKGEQCDFVHTLPASFDARALEHAIGNIQLAEDEEARALLAAEAAAAAGKPRLEVEDFPVLGGGGGGPSRGGLKNGTSAKATAAPQPARARFSSAVKKSAPPSSSSIASVAPGAPARLPSSSAVASSSSFSSQHYTPLPRPSSRLTLRPSPVSSLPTLPTGPALQALYLSARAQALDLGARRTKALVRAADAWRKGDGKGARDAGREGRELGERMRDEGMKAARRILQERQTLLRASLAHRPSPAGKAVGASLGLLLGPGDGLKAEAFIDCHALHGDEAVLLLEQFLCALEADKFSGLAYVMVGEEKHTGQHDVARGTSKVRLAAAVKEWLSQWGYAWMDGKGGVLCVDPLTHFG